MNTLSPASCIWEQKDRQRNALLGDLGTWSGTCFLKILALYSIASAQRAAPTDFHPSQVLSLENTGKRCQKFRECEGHSFHITLLFFTDVVFWLTASNDSVPGCKINASYPVHGEYNTFCGFPSQQLSKSPLTEKHSHTTCFQAFCARAQFKARAGLCWGRFCGSSGVRLCEIFTSHSPEQQVKVVGPTFSLALPNLVCSTSAFSHGDSPTRWKPEYLIRRFLVWEII